MEGKIIRSHKVWNNKPYIDNEGDNDLEFHFGNNDAKILVLSIFVDKKKHLYWKTWFNNDALAKKISVKN